MKELLHKTQHANAYAGLLIMLLCFYENGDDEAAMLLPDGLVYSYLYPKFQREFSSW